MQHVLPSRRASRATAAGPTRRRGAISTRARPPTSMPSAAWLRTGVAARTTAQKGGYSSLSATSNRRRHSPSSCSVDCSLLRSSRESGGVTCGLGSRAGGSSALARRTGAAARSPRSPSRRAGSGRSSAPARILGARRFRLRRAGLPHRLHELGAVVLEDALHAADRVALAVEQVTDAAQQVDVVGPVVAPPAATLHRLDLAEPRFPEPQHMLRHVELVGHLADGAEGVRRLVDVAAPVASDIASLPRFRHAGRRGKDAERGAPRPLIRCRPRWRR